MLNWAACDLMDRRAYWQREVALLRIAEEQREDRMVADMRLRLILPLQAQEVMKRAMCCLFSYTVLCSELQ